MTRLIDVLPTRRPRTSRRALTGRVSLGDSQSVAFESSLERDWIELLDFLPEVSALQVQPFSIEYWLDGAVRRYTPDVAAVWEVEGRSETVVYEVKPREELQKQWALYRPRFVAATRFCRSQGWRFKVVNERHIRTAKLDSVRFLRRYLRLPTDTAVRQHLLTTLRTVGPTTIAGLLKAAYWAPENQAMALPYLWKLVAEYEVRIPWDAPLTMATRIAPEH